MFRNLFVTAAVVFPLILGGCVGSNDRVLSSEGQVQLRNIQSKAYETGDKALVMRAVLSTLQDLGFIIDKADESIGSISATQFTGGATVKMTVSVRVSGKQTIVRANAQYGLSAIEDPKPYQNFFNSLGQSLFLAEHAVD